MNTHPHRLNDPTAQVADAIVGVDMNQPGKVLREHSARADLELDGSSSKTGPEKLEPVQGTRGKSKLPLKYLAGLLDADGSINYQIREWDGPKCGPSKRVQVYLSFHQSGSREFIELVAWSLTPPSCSQYWGHIKLDARHAREAWTWSVGGRHAVSVCNLLKKYLVIKRGLAELAGRVNGQDIDREVVEAAWRAADVPIVPKHPTTKWVAGYLDGDGSFSARCPKDRESAQIVLQVTSEKRRRAGVELLHKQYGGSLHDHTNTGVELTSWVLSFDAAKFRSMFESGKGRLARSMCLKTDQVYFLLGCAKMGHFRDGVAIKAALDSLRAQPHRLSGPGVDVQRLLGTVRDLPSRLARPGNQHWRMRQSELAKAKVTDYEGLSGLDTVAEQLEPVGNQREVV